MIISQDFLHKLAIGIDSPHKIVSWNDICIPMKITESTIIEYFHINDPKGIKKG